MNPNILTRDNEGLYLKYQSYIEIMERLNVKELTITFELFPGHINTDTITYEDCFKLMNIAWEAMQNVIEYESQPHKPKNPHRRTRTHCANGHLLTETNTRYYEDGTFWCANCKDIARNRYEAKQKGLPLPQYQNKGELC